VGIIVLLILPVPPFLLDLLLAISLTGSVLILMTAVLIRKPLEFTSFPTVLLVATLYRLGLNIASTRLILGHGQEGAHGAGAVIESFGNLMMQGNFVIGVIVFIILVVVNFMVVTKGSGRIAEVAARFTLDAMPGKQMAIDADLSTGLIDQDTAKQRRKDLEQESTFFGAMDGASKFVKGDAVAGLIITGINIVGGILIGVVQHKMPIGAASASYTIMTIGDGLVSQIPALIISIAAGLVVSKAGVEGSANAALTTPAVDEPGRARDGLGLVGCHRPDPGHSDRPVCRRLARRGLPGLSPVDERQEAAGDRSGTCRRRQRQPPSPRKSRSAPRWPSTTSRSSWATAC
jgi:flagellar biosynthesis protein FlhA